MNEVACRAVAPFVFEARKQGIDVDRITAGTGLSASFLCRGFKRIDWGTYVQIMRNIEQIWSRDELIRIGENFIQSPLERSSLILARCFFTTRDLYRWLNSGDSAIGRNVFSCINPTFREVGPEHYEIELQLADGFELCSGFFWVSYGSIRALPRVMGAALLRSEFEWLPRGARFRVEINEPRSFVSRLRKVADRGWFAAAGAGELKLAHDELRSRYRELETAQSVLTKQAKQLRTASSISRSVQAKLSVQETARSLVDGLMETAQMTGVRLQINKTDGIDAEGSIVIQGGSEAGSPQAVLSIEVNSDTLGHLSIWGTPESADENDELLSFVLPTLGLALQNAISYEVAVRHAVLQERLRELTHAREAAEKASRLKSDFLAQMSHELRTPLNGVLGMATLLGRTPLNEQQKRYVDVLRGSVERLTGVIGDVLDFSQIEAGFTELEAVEFNIYECVHEVTELLAVSAQSKGLQLVAQFDSATPKWVRGDAGRLRQILLNLVGNAIKFTATGHVTLFVRPEPTASQSGLIQFEVADTGIGIRTEHLDRLFKSFIQAEKATRRHYGGTGLGLAISKSLVELMGGAIGVRANAGGGSVFFFFIPFELAAANLSAREQVRPTTEECVVNPAMTGLKVLLAEDNKVTQLILRTLIGDLGLTVHLAESGVEAVEIFRQQSFDLVLMDVQMPLMDGYEATCEIRRLEAGSRRVPVVAMTATATRSDEHRCLAAGMDDYLVKPLSETTLLRALKRWLPSFFSGHQVEAQSHHEPFADSPDPHFVVANSGAGTPLN